MTEYYYCKACGSVWYTDENSIDKFYAWVEDTPDEIMEATTEKHCGCTEDYQN